MSPRLLAVFKSRAEPDVVVRVRPQVVQVQREHPGIRRVVPVATPDRQALHALTRAPLDCLKPTSDHTPDLVQKHRPVVILLEREILQLLCETDLRPEQVQFSIQVLHRCFLVVPVVAHNDQSQQAPHRVTDLLA